MFISTSTDPPNWEAEVAKEGLGTVANDTYFAAVKQNAPRSSLKKKVQEDAIHDSSQSV